MILERESCTAAQMEIAGSCAKMHRAECSSCIRRTFQADKPPKIELGDFLTRREDMRGGLTNAKRPLGSLAEWPLRRTAGVIRFRHPAGWLGPEWRRS